MNYVRNDTAKVTGSGKASSGTGTGGLRVLWSVNGALSPGRSNDFPFFTGDHFMLTRVYWIVNSTSTSSSTLEIRKNGTALYTRNLAAGTGQYDNLGSLTAEFIDGDVFSLAITNAGAGAADLQAVAVFIPVAS